MQKSYTTSSIIWLIKKKDIKIFLRIENKFHILSKTGKHLLR